MKRVTKKLVALAASFLMLVSVLATGKPAVTAYAEDTAAPSESYYAFVAIGAGDAWEYQYYGKTSTNSGAIEAQDAFIAVGETKTISVTMPDVTTQAWFCAPCIIIPGATEIEYDITAKIDGKDVIIDFSAGKAFWPEATGAWDATECFRLAGGYNEWGDKYIEKPVNFKTIEYTISLKKVVADTTGLGFYSFLGIGASEDWSMGYSGKANNGNYAGVVANDQYVKFEGKDVTVTYALEYDKPVDKVWWMAPVITGGVFKSVDFTVDAIKFDGQEVIPDLSIGDKWWTEGAGTAYPNDSSVRLAGGYNEWGKAYIGGESNPIPTPFTKVEFTVTYKMLSADEKYLAFVAIGGDSDTGSWDMSYTGPGSETEGVEAVTAYVAAGETATISVKFPQNFKHAYYTAPCIIAEGVNLVKGHIDSVKIDGKEVDVNMDAGKFWWSEATGDYDEKHCVRLGGGYNEWATQYISAPENFTSIEYTFTIDKISKGNPAIESNEVFELGIAYGGDKDAENDWGLSYVSGFNELIEGGSEFIKVGETKTVSLKFASKPVNTWYLAPYIICQDTSNVLDVDFDITCKIDGKEVAVNRSAGKDFWTEGTGDYSDKVCIRLAGGYNEWTDKYIDKPVNFTTIEYTITLNSFLVAEPDVVEFDPALLSGVYDAYISFQCPDTWVYRDDWMNEASGGIALWKDIADNFNHVTWNEGATPEEQNIGGTFTDAVIDGNGTYTLTLTGADPGFKGSEKYNMLKVSTTIPYSCLENGLEITEASVSIDGKKPVTDFVLFENKVSSDKYPEYNGSYISIEFINTYNSDNPAALDSVQIPRESMVCKFTVKGFDHDNAAAVEVADEPKANPTEAPKATPEPTAAPEVETAKKDGVNGVVIAIIVVLGIAAVGCCVFFVIKRKKK